MKSPSNTNLKDIYQGKALDLLNKLVKTSNERISGYETASTETDEKEMQSAFADFKQSSLQCRQELVNEIISLGGTSSNKPNLSGKIFRAWMDIKAALTGRDLGPILDSCTTLDEAAIGQYQKVLKNRTDILSTKQHSMINAHSALLKADHTRLVFMRNAALITN